MHQSVIKEDAMHTQNSKVTPVEACSWGSFDFQRKYVIDVSMLFYIINNALVAPFTLPEGHKKVVAIFDGYLCSVFLSILKSLNHG